MIRIARMRRADLERALAWAAAEGWNPGVGDADAFLAADPDGFLMGWLDDAPVAAISVVRHSAHFGFLGLYLCPAEYRGRGFGWALWQAGLAHLGARTIGLDGVPAQEANYRKSGFVPSHRTIRHHGAVVPETSEHIVPVAPTMLPALLALDRETGGVDRPAYLGTWFTDVPSRRTLVSHRDGAITGYGTVRRCLEGCKVGPLVASDADAALALLRSLAAQFPGAPLSLDVPSTNPAATALVGALGLTPVFDTARMYRGAAPRGDVGRVFGEVTLELG